MHSRCLFSGYTDSELESASASIHLLIHPLIMKFWILVDYCTFPDVKSMLGLQCCPYTQPFLFLADVTHLCLASNLFLFPV